MDTIPLIAPHSDRTTLGGLDDYLQRLGPLRALLEDDAITEIMVRGAEDIFIERRGSLELTTCASATTTTSSRSSSASSRRVGRRIDESSPMVDARLPDGSRVNAIIPPLAIDGPVLTIRKFRADAASRVKDLIGFGSLTPGCIEFLRGVRPRSSSTSSISGGTGTGKTTCSTCCSSFIPDGERIVTIEDAAELQLQQPHVVRLETRPPNIEGEGEVTIRDLVKNACACAPTASSSASAAAARPSTCSRP